MSYGYNPNYVGGTCLPTTWEAEIRKIVAWSRTKQKVTENPSQPTSQEKWSIPMITDMQEVVGRKIAVQASPGKNVKP
jgi:hypothetical protein